MVACHFLVELTDGTIQRDIPVLLIHVVVACSGFVAEDNAKCLDMSGSPLKDLIYGEDLALCTLGLELPAEMVPEFGFGNHIVSGEESNRIDLGIGFLLCGESPSHYKILANLDYFN